MSEIVRQEVRTFINNLVCGKCEEGFMNKVTTEMSTIDLSVDPPTFKHMCNKCGHTDWYVKSYPELTYEYVDTVPS